MSRKLHQVLFLLRIEPKRQLPSTNPANTGHRTLGVELGRLASGPIHGKAARNTANMTAQLSQLERNLVSRVSAQGEDVDMGQLLLQLQHQQLWEEKLERWL